MVPGPIDPDNRAAGLPSSRQILLPFSSASALHQCLYRTLHAAEPSAADAAWLRTVSYEAEEGARERLEGRHWMEVVALDENGY